MFTTRMVKLLGVVLDSDKDKVTDELLRKGVMQFVNIAEVEREWSDRLSSVDPGLSLARIADMRKRIESFLSPVGLIPQTPEEIVQFEIKTGLEWRTLEPLSEVHKTKTPFDNMLGDNLDF